MYVCLTGFVSLSRVRSFLQVPATRTATQASNLHDLWTEFSACLERRLLKRRIIVSLCVLASRTYAGVESINLSRTQLRQTSHHSCAYFKINRFDELSSTKRFVVCPRPRWDQNLQFLPLSETTNIPDTFLGSLPPDLCLWAPEVNTFMHEYVCVAGGILKGSITTWMTTERGKPVFHLVEKSWCSHFPQRWRIFGVG